MLKQIAMPLIVKNPFQSAKNLFRFISAAPPKRADPNFVEQRQEGRESLTNLRKVHSTQLSLFCNHMRINSFHCEIAA